MNLLDVVTFHNWVSVLNKSCKVTEDDVWADAALGMLHLKIEGVEYLVRPKFREVIFLDDLSSTFRNQLLLVPFQ